MIKKERANPEVNTARCLSLWNLYSAKLYGQDPEEQRSRRKAVIPSASHILEEKILLLKYTGAKPGFSEELEFMSRSFTQL